MKRGLVQDFVEYFEDVSQKQNNGNPHKRMKFKVHNDDDKTIELDFASLHSELESLKKQQTEELNNNLQLISEKKQLMNELYMYKNSILETEGTIKNLEEKNGYDSKRKC